MRGRSALALIAVALLTAFSAAATEMVVLKDGRSIALAKPYVVKGKVAILTLPDKTVLSVPLTEIDKEKTAEARTKAAAPAPAAAPGYQKPLTPAEAAKVKSTKKSVVSLTDDSVAHPSMAGEEGAPAGELSPKVDLGPVTVKKEKTGYNITGTLMNTGKGEAIAVALTVEGVGADGKTVASGFANVAKDTLGPGEKTTFTVDIPSEGTLPNFRYSPKWREKVASRLSVASGENGPSDQQGEKPKGQPGTLGSEAEPAAAPPAKTEEPKPVPRPDMAAPPASVPVGAPSEPGGVYTPAPSPEGQPKLP